MKPAPCFNEFEFSAEFLCKYDENFMFLVWFSNPYADHELSIRKQAQHEINREGINYNDKNLTLRF
jgi:hypothetical protein